MNIKDDLNALNRFAQILYDKKGMNILALDVKKFCSMTEYYILAEGTVEKHVQALARSLIEEGKSFSLTPLRVEGVSTGDWIVLDFGYIVIHLMIPDVREKYTLEELWREASIVDLTIEVTK